MNIYYKVMLMLFLNGLAAGIGLIALAREFFCQSPLSVMNAALLAAVYSASGLAAGALSGNFTKKGASHLNTALSFSSVLLAFAYPLALFAVRYSRPFFSVPAEAWLPLYAAAITAAVAFMPAGFLYFTALKSGESLAETGGHEKGGLIKFSGVIGAAAGLAIYAFFLWRRFTAMDIIYSMGIMCLAGIYVLFRDKTPEGRAAMLAVIISFIIYLGFNVGGLKETADRHSSKAVYGGHEIIVEKEFPTVKFVLAKKDGKYLVYENAFLTSVINDPVFGDAAKLAKPGTVLVINGGIAGMAAELLKNPAITGITCVEEDRFSSHVLMKVFGEGLKGAKKVAFPETGLKRFLASNRESYDTVFINYRPATAGLFSAATLKLISDRAAASGARIVINAGAEKEKAFKAALKSFGNAAEASGLIVSEKQAAK